MTNQQIAQELMAEFLWEPKFSKRDEKYALIKTIKKLRKLMTREHFSYDWGNMQHNTWDNALEKIDAVCSELEKLND